MNINQFLKHTLHLLIIGNESKLLYRRLLKKGYYIIESSFINKNIL